MKSALLCLLAFTITACRPFPETEEETERRLKKSATPTASPIATPKPTPKPGAWMNENRDSPLGIKKNPLDQKPTH
jgi:hypothetical protein